MNVPRVLIVRCCRTSRLMQALDVVRDRYPAAAVSVLCHESAVAEVRTSVAQGFSPAIITYRGRRIGARHALLVARHGRFDTVVIPYMIPDDAGHANVLQLAAMLGAPEVLILREAQVDACNRRRLLRLAAWATLGRAGRILDVPLLLAALALACLVKRREDPPRPGRSRRVLHVISGFGAGGAQRQLAQLLAHTPPDRYDTDILVLARYEGAFSQMHLPARATVKYIVSWPNLTLALWEIVRVCRRKQYDIVHTWLFAANLVGVAAARLTGTPRVVASVRNMSLWKRQWYHRPWFRIADALASRAADVVTVNARALADDHARWAWYPARRIEVVPNGLDVAALMPLRDGARERLADECSFDPADVVVGTVGRLAPEKDQSTFLRIVARLRYAVPGLRGVIVGGGDAEPALRAMARQLDIDDIVSFVGETPDAPRLIAGFDLFLLTSLCEGLPNVLLEAAFLGVPCVATHVGGAAEILEDGNLLFTPGDDEDGYHKVRACLELPGMTTARTARIRRRALERFTAGHMVRAWMRIYDPETAAAGVVAQERAA